MKKRSQKKEKIPEYTFFTNIDEITPNKNKKPKEQKETIEQYQQIINSLKRELLDLKLLKHQKEYISKLKKAVDKYRVRNLVLAMSTIFFMIFFFFASYSWVSMARRINYIESDLIEYCDVMGYDTGVLVDEGEYQSMWCVNSKPYSTKRLAEVLLKYVDFYYGANKYDVRGYGVDYKGCKDNPLISYQSNNKTLIVRCIN